MVNPNLKEVGILVMYRYIICVTFALLVLIIGTGCTTNLSKKNSEYESTKSQEKYNNMMTWALYVNGEVVDGLNVFVSSTNARLPFVQTIEALGITVERQGDAIYVRVDGDTYILCYSPCVSFVLQGDTDNLMDPPPGSSSYYCQYELGDVVLDSNTLECVLYRMGVDIDISVDRTTFTIAIWRK